MVSSSLPSIFFRNTRIIFAIQPCWCYDLLVNRWHQPRIRPHSWRNMGWYTEPPGTPWNPLEPSPEVPPLQLPGPGALDVGSVFGPAVDGFDLRAESFAHQSHEARQGRALAGRSWACLGRAREDFRGTFLGRNATNDPGVF